MEQIICFMHKMKLVFDSCSTVLFQSKVFTYRFYLLLRDPTSSNSRKNILYIFLSNAFKKSI
jgi:hypothetical protein